MKKVLIVVSATGIVSMLIALRLPIDVLLQYATHPDQLLRNEGMFSPFALWLFGFFASFHCLGMCGGVILQTTTSHCHGKVWLAHFQYHAARVAMCTIVGAALGIIGDLFTVNRRALGILPLLCGIAMLLSALQSAGILHFLKLLFPNAVGRRINEKLWARPHVRPWVVGMATALFPCGMLQTAQMYALGMGHAIYGALSMLCFALGTVPVLLALALMGQSLLMRFRKPALWISAALTVYLSIGMILRGIKILGG